MADVDHFFPRVLLQSGLRLALDNMWNLVLACRACDRAKSSLLPEPKLLERLHTRNEHLIASHHHLRETLVAQTGRTVAERARFLHSADAEATVLVHPWSAVEKHEPTF